MCGLRASALLAVSMFACATGWAQPQPWKGFDSTLVAIELSAEEIVDVFEYGRSRDGSPLRGIRLGTGVDPDAKPGIAIVAGLDGRHHTGSRVAVSLAARIADRHADLLADATLYVLPAANPDGLARWRNERPRVPGPVGSPVANDDDDDRRIDEDGPIDLDGDGFITMMRVEDPGPGTGLRADHVLDEDDPRLVRKAGDEEPATHALVVEGRDQDSDGSIAEDGPGGVDLDRNFPYRWEEFAEGVGPYSLSEPETRALADWFLAHENLYAVVVYTPKDTLVSISPAGKMDETGEVLIGILKEDAGVFAALSEAFKEATKQTGAPTGEARGSLQRWAYAHLGLVSASTPVWVRPDLVQTEERPAEGEGDAERGSDQPEPEDPGEDEYQALLDRGVPERIARFLTADDAGRAQMRAEIESMSQEERGEMMRQMMSLPEDVRTRVMAVARGQPDPGAPGEADSSAGSSAGKRAKRGKGGESDGAKWLAYADERGEGFVQWRSFEHPELGPVEIGGFVPGFRINAPESEQARLVDEQTAFLDTLVGLMPRLEATATGERLGTGLARIRVRLTNRGDLPTRSAMGERARRLPPIRVWIDLPDERVVSGARRQNTWGVPAHGGVFDAEWVVTSEGTEEIRIEIRSAVFGDRVLRVAVGENQ